VTKVIEGRIPPRDDISRNSCAGCGAGKWGGEETMSEINASTSVAEVLQRCPTARRIFDRHGLKGCGGAHGPTESLAFFASVHQADVDELLRELNAEGAIPSPEGYVYQESIADYIYRRFFKAGIAITLTVGVLWGAINLLQIGLAGNFLQLHLVPSIHAHAHAMIFGWVGLFVMGFAYQSFPRFKYTTLWRPGLANLTLYLMLAGIGARVGAELLQPHAIGMALGVLSAAVELAAISLFLTILFKTARKSVSAPNPYEKFIFAACVWFLTQSIFSDFFFFAKATAQSAAQLVWRIALLDGPLRDLQLLGFAALIIAGVSQRFIPVVYGLAKPRRDRQTLIFILINASLVLDIVCYMGLLSTRSLYFALGLELSYILMAVWGALLVIQLGIFSKPSQTDRSWKFIRAAYVWLLFALFMMPFMVVYNAMTHQMFSHAFWGSHRHAYTVGFISLMIIGVSSRVVPILAGVDSSRLTSLWAPFVLLNVGCAGRVSLQILTDIFPGAAFPLVGLTGFVELTALAWWGVGLWRVMDLAKTSRAKLLTGPFPILAR
jgi:hypothetical protein